MSKELIESLRYLANRPPYSGAADIMLRAADALEAKAEPVGDDRGHDTKGSRKALGAMNAKLKAKIGRLERELAAYQQPQSAEAVASKWGFGEQGRSPFGFTVHAEKAEQWRAEGKDVYIMEYAPQPSAGVVMPDAITVSPDWLKQIHRDLDACQKLIWANLRGCDPAYCADAQARLAEIEEMLARLNGKEVGRG